MIIIIYWRKVTIYYSHGNKFLKKSALAPIFMTQKPSIKNKYSKNQSETPL